MGARVTVGDTTIRGARSRPGRGAWTWRRLVALGLRCLVGGIFLYAGVSKAGDPVGFAEAVRNYRILPGVWPALLVGVALPWVEILAGAMLVLGVWVRPASIVATGLMAVFVGALISVVVRGIDISCGCFGPQSASSDPVTALTVARDALLLVLAALCWYLHTDEL